MSFNRVTLPLDNIVSVLLLVIQSWVSFVSRSRLPDPAIFLPLNVSLSSKFYHRVPSEVPIFLLGTLQNSTKNLTINWHGPSLRQHLEC